MTRKLSTRAGGAVLTSLLLGLAVLMTSGGSASAATLPAGSVALSSWAPSSSAPSAAPSSSSRWGGERAAWTRPTTTTPAPSSSPAPTSSAPATSTAPTSTAPAAGLTALEQDAFNRINAERAKAGCAALTVDPKIQAVARAHSEDMRDRNYFDHATPEGVSPAQRLTQGGVSWRSMGENIARGQRDAATVVTGWMNSSGHRANIVNCGFKTSGLGVATGGNGPYWTQDFVG
jgi:uncharacterized protein YkwD